jgi:hypothetical protein
MRYTGIYSDGGFSSSATPPVALEVCKESRDLVIDSYPLCFGSIYHPAQTRFNLSMDILVFDLEFQRSIPHFLGIMKEKEISGLRYLAIASDILESFRPFRDLKTPLRRALKSFSGLKELLVVYDIADMNPRIHADIDSFMTLYETLPENVQTCKELQSGGEPIQELPSAAELEDMEVWSVPKCRPIYGWRRCTCLKVMDSEVEDSETDDESDMYDDDDMFPSGFHWTGY